MRVRRSPALHSLAQAPSAAVVRGEAAVKVARALAASPERVRVHWTGANRRHTAIHCRGTLNNRAFFAKILPRETFDLAEPVSDPAARATRATRTRCEQIAAEVAATERFRSSGRVDVQELLGRSEDTLVWRLAAGEPLDRAFASRWSRSRRLVNAETAFHDVGAWLREMHDASNNGVAVLDLDRSIRALDAYTVGESERARSRVNAARELLCLARGRLGDSRVEVPAAFTHGDLTPPNVLSGAPNGRLTVVDFEHARQRGVSHDLVTMLARVHARLLDPRVSISWVSSLERALLEGYGPVSRELRLVCTALASAWVFYEYLGGAAVRARSRGVSRRVAALAYERIVEGRQAARALSTMVRELQEI